VPLLARIVAQGRAEGWPTAGKRDDVARVLVSLIQGANEAATELYIARQAHTIEFDDVEPRLAAYRVGMERILGVPVGSLSKIDRPTLYQWFG